MALVRIDFSGQQAPGFAEKAAALVNRVMCDLLSVPEAENFVISQAHASGALLHDPLNCPSERRDQIVFIQITLNQGRSAELKARFFAALTEKLVAAVNAKPENVYINLVEVARENWSFGQAGG